MYLTRIYTPITAALAIHSSAFAQCIVPSCNGLANADAMCPSLDPSPSFRFNPMPGTIVGTPPFHYFWEYDRTGHGDWTSVPTNVEPVTIQGFNATASGGNAAMAIVHVDFTPGMQLVYSVRLTISNACGSCLPLEIDMAICLANFNCDAAGVDYRDYFEFVDAFSRSDTRGDYNRDSAIDFFDYLDFVAAYAAGCPGY